ncbi:hypothetical protein AMIS_41630 [Actinoplanes missouriensis 431]|uniref:Uncharacterized protein n=1 Tax=Actinoplanes missouriensis (strain ATCC 14538 / DSM 43046 / CBS 188.64 / JCM 3121 / NBRC 102363 / NCIMB 12654 / NRRL B-3342 / UNCC 431) TaxID=512565 RepID=I0H8P6_ACTM4|nr:hypothetical protein [Actinoplanes missouriensis]BAL89383.1 hypothetical protein AMIS_41630 [Actinoplanes missouriensis 431]
MAGRFREKASVPEARVVRWRFPCFAFSAGVLSLCAGGLLGGVLAFGVAAAIAWRTGRRGALRWALTALAVLCLVGLAVVGLDAGFGVGTLISGLPARRSAVFGTLIGGLPARDGSQLMPAGRRGRGGRRLGR